MFITELVFTLFVFKYQNHFEFPKDGKRSPCLKIPEIRGGREIIKDPLEWKIQWGWGGIYIFWNHTSHAKEKYQKMKKAVIQKKPKSQPLQMSV